MKTSDKWAAKVFDDAATKGTSVGRASVAIVIEAAIKEAVCNRNNQLARACLAAEPFIGVEWASQLALEALRQ